MSSESIFLQYFLNIKRAIYALENVNKIWLMHHGERARYVKENFS